MRRDTEACKGLFAVAVVGECRADVGLLPRERAAGNELRSHSKNFYEVVVVIVK